MEQLQYVTQKLDVLLQEISALRDYCVYLRMGEHESPLSFEQWLEWQFGIWQREHELQQEEQ